MEALVYDYSDDYFEFASSVSHWMERQLHILLSIILGLCFLLLNGPWRVWKLLVSS